MGLIVVWSCDTHKAQLFQDQQINNKFFLQGAN